MRSLSDYQISKDFLDGQNALRLKAFKENRRLQNLSFEHRGILGAVNYEEFKKQSVDLKNGERLDIITNQNLTHDTTVLWHTSGASVRKALRMGQLNPEALTAKAIQALGNYYKKTAERAIKSRITSRLEKEKSSLVDSAQDAIEDLQAIERNLGCRVHSESAESFAKDLLGTLNEYIKKQEDSPSRNQLLDPAWDELLWLITVERQKRNKAAAEKLRALIQANIDENKNKAEWLETSGNEELLSFLKERILATARETQALNQILTHKRGSGAYLRGDLNGYIEDMIKVVREHEQDLHNPVTCDHQLTYSADAQVVVDSDFHTDGSAEALDQMMLAVSVISGDNDPLNAPKGEVKATSATKWRHLRSFYDATNPYSISLFSSAAHFWGMAGNLLLAPFSLLEAMVRGNKANWVDKLRYKPGDNAGAVEGKTDYYALAHRTKKQSSLSIKIGLELHKAFTYFFWEGLAKGLYDGAKQISQLPIDLLTDFQNQTVTVEEVLPDLKNELQAFKRRKEALLTGLVMEAETEEASPVAEVYYAEPAISLKPYHSHGLLNGGVSGLTEFIDLFGHNMFAKHPFTAMLSSFGAAVSFGAFFAEPLFTKLFGKAYVQFLQSQGYIWTKDLGSASMAGSFTNFKLIGTLIEALEHGPDSWLSKSISTLLNDPARAITYTALAWVIGYALVDLVEIPGLSEELRKHIGNPPQLSEIFGGAKMGIIAYQLFSTPQEDEQALRENYIEEAVNNYKKLRAEQEQSVSDSEIEAFRRLVDQLLDDLCAGVHQARDLSPSPEEAKFSLLLHLGMNKHELSRLSPLLKAKLQPLLPELVASKADAIAIDKCLDPDKYAGKSTLRSFLGRTISYFPVLVRCALSPFAVLVSRSPAAFVRPWKELGEMCLDDFTSSFQAVSRLMNKVLETLFNRLPRTLADIVVNGVIARTASLFGYHQVTLLGYKASAAWDWVQEYLYANTTGRILNCLVRANSAPHPEVGFNNGLKARIQKSVIQSGVSADKRLPSSVDKKELSAQSIILEKSIDYDAKNEQKLSLGLS